jgi:hypothetical protein
MVGGAVVRKTLSQHKLTLAESADFCCIKKVRGTCIQCYSKAYKFTYYYLLQKCLLQSEFR